MIDYKTGDVFEHGEDDVVKASYIRQLQIYAFLVRESTGRWPTRGVLLPMEGPPVEIDIEPSACECVAAEALDLLDRYNNEILTQPNSADFANPSPDTCRWCPYQLVCPSFWSAADESWSEQFGSAALAGLASSGPVPIHGGSAFTLSLNVDEGTEVANVVGLAPLRSEDHLALSRVQQGTHVRVVGLAKRADGTVLPTKRTVIARTEDLPEIVVVQSAASTTSSAST